MLTSGNYSITAEKTITGGIPKSWCDYSPEVTCGLHPHHISGVTDDDDFVINVFRRQGCPHLGQGHGPIVSSIDSAL